MYTEIKWQHADLNTLYKPRGYMQHLTSYQPCTTHGYGILANHWSTINERKVEVSGSFKYPSEYIRGIQA